MGAWQQIWSSANGGQLWAVPDPAVVRIADYWKQAGGIRRVVDIGCGAGRHLAVLAAAGFDAYGLDNSAAGLARCEGLLQQMGRSATLTLADLAALPFPDNFFDAGIAFNAIYHGHRAYVEKAVQELHRALRPGGQCLVTMPSRQHRLYGKGEPAGPHTFRSPAMFPGLFAHEGEQGELHYYSSEEDLADLFRDFTLLSLDHEELQLPVADGKAVRVPRGYFWRVVVRK